MDGLGDVGGVDLVVVGVAVLAVTGLQRVQQRGQEDGGDLRHRHTRPWVRPPVPSPRPAPGHTQPRGQRRGGRGDAGVP